ncbi:uncharacterized protein DUF4037 [Kribbella steppae]|uniref:Uncharacterized protein DUF4037 n=1 Tax=Kribbella steppae TaxID=2512223 RepID=A0A4V2S0G6_9ACTN|nr:DUF4037 domain-containing protein [Kribbella steppae]TCO32600.1 uncharacterized protein DUF4037 [Kribbella steppae]
MGAFVSGLELSRRFYTEAVRPVLEAWFPDLPYSAALLGRGSEVLGFDDAMSGDHNWEPRVLLFLRKDDQARNGDRLADALSREVPTRFADRPTEYGIHTLRGYFLEQLDFDVEGEIRARDWFTFPEQNLRMVTAGAVFHDEISLTPVRERLAYYPRDVWLYLQIAAWWRVHPEVNLAGRTGFVGDELGSALIGSQLVHDLMRLCFLMERQYAPYSKWFGTAFSRLSCAAELSPLFSKVLVARSWQEREEALMAAYSGVAQLHNTLEITAPVTIGVEQLWDRPFKVVWGDFPGALVADIKDPEVRRIAERWPVGGIDQIRNVLWAARDRRQLIALFD